MRPILGKNFFCRQRVPGNASLCDWQLDWHFAVILLALTAVSVAPSPVLFFPPFFNRPRVVLIVFNMLDSGTHCAYLMNPRCHNIVIIIISDFYFYVQLLAFSESLTVGIHKKMMLEQQTFNGGENREAGNISTVRHVFPAARLLFHRGQKTFHSGKKKPSSPFFDQLPTPSPSVCKCYRVCQVTTINFTVGQFVVGYGHIYDHVMMTSINNTAVFVVALKVSECMCVCGRKSDVRSGVDSGVSRGTLWNTGTIVDDVFIAGRLPVLVQLLSLPTLVVELLDSQEKHVWYTYIYTSVCLHVWLIL